MDVFDLVVAENGGLLYDPATCRERVLAEPPPADLVAFLRANAVAPLSVGRVVVATFEPHQAMALAAIRQLGLGHQVVLNKGAVMLLPRGVDKASGLRAALRELGVHRDRVVGVGDAENDHVFLASCGLGVAVGNALSSLKASADYVTRGRHGEGVSELIELLVTHDLRHVGRALDGAARL